MSGSIRLFYSRTFQEILCSNFTSFLPKRCFFSGSLQTRCYVLLLRDLNQLAVMDYIQDYWSSYTLVLLLHQYWAENTYAHVIY